MVLICTLIIVACSGGILAALSLRRESKRNEQFNREREARIRMIHGAS